MNDCFMKDIRISMNRLSNPVGWSFAAALGLMLTTCGWGPVGAQAIAVRMSCNPSCPLPVVYARINGGGQLLPFVVDFGTANPLILDRRTAEQAKVKLASEDRVGRLHGEDVYQVKLGSLDIEAEEGKSPLNFVNVQTTVEELHVGGDTFPGPPIVGVIGWFAFRTIPVKLEFEKQRLVVYPNGTRPIIPEAALQVPLKAAGFNLTIPIELSRMGPTVQAALDTGSVFSMIPEIRRGQFDVVKLVNEKISMLTLRGIVESKQALVQSIAVGSLSLGPVHALVTSHGEPTVLGMAVLRDYTLILDIPAGTMWIEKRRRARSQPIIGTPFLTLDRAGPRLIIDSLDASSPAARAGVRNGDIVVACDGYAMAGLTLGAARALIVGYAGTRASLTVVRRGKQSTFEFIRSSPFDNPPSK